MASARIMRLRSRPIFMHCGGCRGGYQRL